ncbi:MAG TPA: hypothetical protein VJT82_03560 [Pyrinomonadaceae bacterium]|nr:hypothetical protein [Pyrinomonadaceae bacterium]
MTGDRLEGQAGCFTSSSATGKDVTKRINLVTRETKVNILFETRDRSASGPWLHRSYIKK